MPIAQLAYIILVLAAYAAFMIVLGFYWARGSLDSLRSAKTIKTTQPRGRRV